MLSKILGQPCIAFLNGDRDRKGTPFKSLMAKVNMDLFVLKCEYFRANFMKLS